MAERYDLIVIGTGAGGSAAAYRCRKAGWRVGVVDELPYGGTCALRGCDPKKVLVGAAELVDWHHRMRKRGITGEVHISWPDLMRFKRTFTDPVPINREKAFEKAGIATLHGHTRFVSPDQLSVDTHILEARHFVIAYQERSIFLRALTSSISMSCRHGSHLRAQDTSRSSSPTSPSGRGLRRSLSAEESR